MLPPDLSAANISPLLNPDKDSVYSISYQPISLINIDLQIICTALAKHLEKVIPSLIHTDQTGFIK